MDSLRVEKERKRLENLLKGAEISSEKRGALEAIIDNLSWMKVKLDDTREEIKDASIIVDYDNGGGQTGTRLNPAFKGYSELWRNYMLGLNAFIEYLPTEAREELTPDTSVLDRVKRMKQVK